MSVGSLRGLAAQTVHRFPKAPLKHCLPITLAKVGIAGSMGKPYWIPEKNGPGLKGAVQQITAYREFATQSKPPKPKEEMEGFSPFAKDAINFLENNRGKISFIELQPPETPLTEREIGRILETLAQTRSQWHSLVLVPPTELLEDGPFMKNPQAVHFEEAMEKIKMSLPYPSISFLNVSLRSGALIRLLHYALQEGYLIQVWLNAPSDRDWEGL